MMMAENGRETKPTQRWRGQMRQWLKLSEAQAALGWGIILLLAAVLGTIYLAQASSIAEVGRRMQLLQFELEDLKRQNGEIERDIAESQSLEQLQNAAIQLGFRLATPEDIEYVIVPNYPSDEVIGEQPLPTAVASSESKPIDTIKEAIWVAITHSFSGLTRGESVEQ